MDESYVKVNGTYPLGWSKNESIWRNDFVFVKNIKALDIYYVEKTKINANVVLKKNYVINILAYIMIQFYIRHKIILLQTLLIF